MQGKEIVELVKTEYPKFDFSLLSKCRKPQEYGVQLVPGARRLIETERPRRRDNRKKEHRYSFRLSKSTHERLQTAKKAYGIVSNQTFIEAILIEWLERRAQCTTENGTL